MVALVQAASTAPAPGPASAASTSIVVLVPAAATSSLRDALNRLRGEADSVGFSIQLRESSPAADPPGQLQQVATALSPAAVVALVEPPKGAALAAIDVWCLDGSSGKQSVGHLVVENEAGDRAELVLAVRVVDFIRARMFDSLVRSSMMKRSEPLARHDMAGKHFVAVGLAATGRFSGFPAAFMPGLSVGLGLRRSLRLVVAAAGWGSKPRRETAVGSTRIDETLFLLGAELRTHPWWRVFAVANLGVSALLVSAQGEGKPGYLGHDVSGWSPGLYASVGAGVVLAAHLQWLVSGGGTLLYRQPQVLINEVEVARTGEPAWLASTLLAVSF